MSHRCCRSPLPPPAIGFNDSATKAVLSAHTNTNPHTDINACTRVQFWNYFFISSFVWNGNYECNVLFASFSLRFVDWIAWTKNKKNQLCFSLVHALSLAEFAKNNCHTELSTVVHVSTLLHIHANILNELFKFHHKTYSNLEWHSNCTQHVPSYANEPCRRDIGAAWRTRTIPISNFNKVHGKHLLLMYYGAVHFYVCSFRFVSFAPSVRIISIIIKSMGIGTAMEKSTRKIVIVVHCLHHSIWHVEAENSYDARYEENINTHSSTYTVLQHFRVRWQLFQ